MHSHLPPLQEESTFTARAPTRVDLAGGTLDIWPLAPILQEKCALWREPVVTVNVAIDLEASAEVVLRPGPVLRWCFADETTSAEGSLDDIDSERAAAYPLHRASLRYVIDDLLACGVGYVSIRSAAQAPRGSGLGGSSSLIVSILFALERLLGRPEPNLRDLCLRAQALEAGILGTLAGNQDHFAAAFGGVQAVRHSADGTQSGHLRCCGASLLDRLVLAYSGIQHHSGFNNWLILERVLTGHKETLERCAGIACCARDIVKPLELGDWKEVGSIMSREWGFRRELAKGISTPTLDAMYEAAQGAGAWGGKVCGAGGGGVLVSVVEPSRRAAVEQSIQAVGGKILKAKYSLAGVQEFIPGRSSSAMRVCS